MRRATTPTHTFTLPDTVLVNELVEVLITYSQDKKNVLEKRLSDISVSTENNALIVNLTQKEATLFAPGKALVQIRVKNEDSSVLASQMMWIEVKAVLNSEEL